MGRGWCNWGKTNSACVQKSKVGFAGLRYEMEKSKVGEAPTIPSCRNRIRDAIFEPLRSLVWTSSSLFFPSLVKIDRSSRIHSIGHSVSLGDALSVSRKILSYVCVVAIKNKKLKETDSDTPG